MTKTCPDCQATVLSTSQPKCMGNLIDRLRNPMWVHSTVAFDGPQLEQEENLAAMNEAADKLAALAATPAVAGERKALEAARQEIVLTLAFLGRDNRTNRLSDTINGLCKRLAKADQAILAALASPPEQPAAPNKDPNE